MSTQLIPGAVRGQPAMARFCRPSKVQRSRRRTKVPLLFLKEGPAVCHQVLEVPYLGPIDGRIEDLGDAAVSDSEPHPAVARVGRSYPIPVSLCPARLNAGPSKGILRSDECSRLRLLAGAHILPATSRAEVLKWPSSRPARFCRGGLGPASTAGSSLARYRGRQRRGNRVRG
jgi:hypothetical protein